jgi:hypothetical protein
MRARLNGWQRLWVIISILYLLPVVGITIMLWPSPETTWHRDEFITRMPAELRGKIEGAYESKWKWEEARKKGGVSAEVLEKNYEETLKKEGARKQRTVLPSEATPKAQKGKIVSPPLPPLTGGITRDLPPDNRRFQADPAPAGFCA